MDPEKPEFLLVYFRPDNREPETYSDTPITFRAALEAQRQAEYEEPALQGRMGIFCETIARYV
jgi:hypothetical protein